MYLQIPVFHLPKHKNNQFSGIAISWSVLFQSTKMNVYYPLVIVNKYADNCGLDQIYLGNR